MEQQFIDQAVAHYRALLESQVQRAKRMNQAQEAREKREKIIIGTAGGDGIGPIITRQARRALEALLREVTSNETAGREVSDEQDHA